MGYIHRLPLIMALMSAILTGLVGYTRQIQNNKNMANMLIAMVMFYIIGSMIKRTILDIIRTYSVKALDRANEKKRLAMEKENNEGKALEGDNNALQENISTLNLVADEKLDFEIDGESFSPLPVADYIEKELKK